MNRVYHLHTGSCNKFCYRTLCVSRCRDSSWPAGGRWLIAPPPYTNLPPVPYTSAYWHDPPGSDLWPGRRVDAAACLAVPAVVLPRTTWYPSTETCPLSGQGYCLLARFRWENELHILVSRYGRNHTWELECRNYVGYIHCICMNTMMSYQKWRNNQRIENLCEIPRGFLKRFSVQARL